MARRLLRLTPPTTPFETGASIISHNIASAMCAPLTCQSRRLGVIYGYPGATNAFVQRPELLVALAGPAGVAIRMRNHVRMLEKAYEDTLSCSQTPSNCGTTTPWATRGA